MPPSTLNGAVQTHANGLQHKTKGVEMGKTFRNGRLEAYSYEKTHCTSPERVGLDWDRDLKLKRQTKRNNKKKTRQDSRNLINTYWRGNYA